VRTTTGEEPRLGLQSAPVLAQGFQQDGAEHDVPILCAGKGYVPGITAIYKRHRLPQSAARVALIAQLHITMAVLLG
jgi:hypothetical protein